MHWLEIVRSKLSPGWGLATPERDPISLSRLVHAAGIVDAHVQLDKFGRDYVAFVMQSGEGVVLGGAPGLEEAVQRAGRNFEEWLLQQGQELLRRGDAEHFRVERAYRVLVGRV